ncbi:MAG: MFS transporter [Firmicutes bacterium]|nr:MFS transporter [Bacillota bacterium]
MREKESNGYVKYIMSFGHFCVDFTQGTLSAVLPFLIASYSYSYATAATLVMVSNLIGSVIQPIFGHLADKIDRPHLMTLGVVMAGGGMCVVGFIPSYAGLCIAVVISGIGVAMFHPQGARMVNKVATEENMGMSMGIFSFGGNAGFTVGPALATFAMYIAGLKGTLLFFVPALIFACIMTVFYRNYESQDSFVKESDEALITKEKDRWGAFAGLGGFIVCRSIIFSCISTFLILYLMEEYGLSEQVGSLLLSLYYGLSALASLLGGKLADMTSFKKTMIISSILLLIAAILLAISGSVVIVIIALIPLGLGISLCYSSMVAMGQNYLPNHVGLASGVTLGLSVSIGGIVVPFLGKIGDLYNLSYIFYIVAGLSVLPLVISCLLPKK